MPASAPSGLPFAGAFTFAALPAASGVAAGTHAWVTNLGPYGTLMVSNGTRWRPLDNRAVLHNLTAAVSGIAATETIVQQVQLPAGLLQTNDLVQLLFTLNKSGLAGAANVKVRVGTNGTTADTQVSSHNLMDINSQTGACLALLKVASATSMQVCGPSAAGNLLWMTGGTSPAPVAISNVSNALWVSLTLARQTNPDTIGIMTGSIELITL